jgi:sugar phosphate isomerase/epimerase
MKNVIFISTGNNKKKNIISTVKTFIKHDIKNIELSGGNYKENRILKKELLKLKKKYSLNFLIHNYFPPERKKIVLNLGSLDKKIYDETINFYEKSIKFGIDIDSKYYAIHAGFLFDPVEKELGRIIKSRQLYNCEKSIANLKRGYMHLKSYSKKKIKIFLENNVISSDNYKNFGCNPFHLTNFKDFLQLRKKFNFDILLDIAHLKVSSRTLKKSFKNELKNFKNYTNYIHLSSNNGFSDSNKSLIGDNDYLKLIFKNFQMNNYITTEVYGKLSDIISSYLYIKKKMT